MNHAQNLPPKEDGETNGARASSCSPGLQLSVALPQAPSPPAGPPGDDLALPAGLLQVFAQWGTPRTSGTPRGSLSGSCIVSAGRKLRCPSGSLHPD